MAHKKYSIKKEDFHKIRDIVITEGYRGCSRFNKRLAEIKVAKVDDGFVSNCGGGVYLWGSTQRNAVASMINYMSRIINTIENSRGFIDVDVEIID